MQVKELVQTGLHQKEDVLAHLTERLRDVQLKTGLSVAQDQFIWIPLPCCPILR